MARTMRTLVAVLWPPLVGVLVAMFVADLVRDHNLVVSKAPPSGLQWSPVSSEEKPRGPAVDRAQAAAGACEANFDSQPPGARVTVNGQGLGNTPLESAVVPCGTLAVTMSHEHYRPQTRTVEVVPGQVLDLTVRLRRAIGVQPRPEPGAAKPEPGAAKRDPMAALP